MSTPITAHAIVAAILLSLLTSAVANAGRPVDGSWGGADAKGRTAQIVVAGGELLSAYVVDDYYQPTNVRILKGGAEIDFTAGSAAVSFVRTDQGGTLTIRRPGQPTLTIKAVRD